MRSRSTALWAVLIGVLLTGPGVSPAAAANGSDLYNQGIRKYDVGQFRTAIDLFSRALAMGDLSRDSMSQAYYMRGLSQGRLGNRDEAIKNYREAVNLNPRYAKALGSLCYQLGQAGKLDMALYNCNIALELKPDDGPAYGNRADIWAKKKEFARAEADFRRAIELMPSRWTLYYNFALFFHRQGKRAPARENLAKAYKLAPAWGRSHPSTSPLFREYGIAK